MKKVLCLILALSLAILSSAAALADGLISFDLEIVNDQPVSNGEKPSSSSGSSSSSSSSDSSEMIIDIPTVVLPPSNGGSGNSGSSGSSGSSNSSNGGSSSSNNSSSDSNVSSPVITPDSGALTPAEQLMQNAANASNVSSSGNDTNVIPYEQVPLDSGAQTSNSINENVPQLDIGPAIDVIGVTPLDEGIEENEITDFELNGDAMHSLRIRASVAPGSVVNVGDRVELTAIPMGFTGVNYKIQWQMAEVDANGKLGEFRNIPGAFGAKYVIVFTEKNIKNHWRAAIKIVD